MKRTCTALLCLALLSCRSGEEATDHAAATDQEQTVAQRILSAKNGAIATTKLAPLQYVSSDLTRASAPMGVFTSSYLAQRGFVSVRSALIGVAAQRAIIADQLLPTSKENFAILEELGNIIEIDFIELLNRSSDRAQELDDYLEDLSGTVRVAQQKLVELEVAESQYKKDRKDQRKQVRSLDKEIKDTLRNEDYGKAADIQEELTEAQSKLARTETLLDQTEDMVDRFQDMIDIALERGRAIAANREIIIAGLRVVNVPGTEELNILEGGRSARRSRSGDGSGGSAAEIENDIFGVNELPR